MQFQLCELSTLSSPYFANLIIREGPCLSSSDCPFVGSCCAVDAQRFGQSR